MSFQFSETRSCKSVNIDYDFFKPPCQNSEVFVIPPDNDSFAIDDDYLTIDVSDNNELEDMNLLAQDPLVFALKAHDYYSATLLIQKGAQYKHLIKQFPILTEILDIKNL